MHRPVRLVLMRSIHGSKNGSPAWELPFFAAGDYSPSTRAFLRNRKLIHHSPASPTTVYTTRLNREPVPPNSQATRSKRKIPTSPQLMHPIMDKISARVSIMITFLSSFDMDRVRRFLFFIRERLQKNGFSVIME